MAGLGVLAACPACPAFLASWASANTQMNAADSHPRSWPRAGGRAPARAQPRAAAGMLVCLAAGGARGAGSATAGHPVERGGCLPVRPLAGFSASSSTGPGRAQRGRQGECCAVGAAAWAQGLHLVPARPLPTRPAGSGSCSWRGCKPSARPCSGHTRAGGLQRCRPTCLRRGATWRPPLVSV